jgi:NAD(P)-dependent dehydrogenase (short-subunit alcohol dehydrogenase family)
MKRLETFCDASVSAQGVTGAWVGVRVDSTHGAADPARAQDGSGSVDTPQAPLMFGEVGERLKQAMVNSTALKRSGQPEEVAAAIAFLASEDASYVTGQTLNVSGGLSMW